MARSGVVALLAASLATAASAALRGPPTAHLARGGSRSQGTAAVVVTKASPECENSLKDLRAPATAKKAATCEQEKKLEEQVITHLQAGKKDEAVAIAQSAFEQCGNMTKACSAEVAPGVVQELRLSGVALSDTCKKSVRQAQSDKKAMQDIRKCEKDQGVASALMKALRGRDLDAAVLAAEGGLEKCMKVTKECAFQVAPVLVNQVVTMSAMNAGGMMPVFVRSALKAADSAEKAPHSLLALGAAKAPASTPAAGLQGKLRL